MPLPTLVPLRSMLSTWTILIIVVHRSMDSGVVNSLLHGSRRYESVVVGLC